MDTVGKGAGSEGLRVALKHNDTICENEGSFMSYNGARHCVSVTTQRDGMGWGRGGWEIWRGTGHDAILIRFCMAEADTTL